ncbi:NB-ARC domain-containing disease resistance protein, partial [Prunus dulcis]
MTKPEGTASIVDLQIELTAAIPQRRESGDFRCQMDTVGILVCYNGSWVKKDNIESYEGGEAKGIIVSRNVTFSELVQRIYKIMDAEPTKYSVTLKYSVPVSASVSKHIRVEDNDDVQYFLKYNTDVMASKVTPLVASLKNIEGHGIEGCNGIVSVESSNAPATFVVERRNVAISHNETENGGNGFNWSDWVEEVHFESEEPYSAPIVHPHEDSSAEPSTVQCRQVQSEPPRQSSSSEMHTIRVDSKHGESVEYIGYGGGLSCINWEANLKVPCPWKLRAYKVGLHEFKVVKYDPLHECDLRFVSSHHPQATAELVSDCVKWRFQDSRSIYTAADIKTDVKKKFGVSISYSTAWRSRELAFKTMRGSAEE